MGVNYGDRNLALTNEILRGLVGSRVHGVHVDDQDDRDETGIYIAPPDHMMGLYEPETHIWRTKNEGERSGPGDLDLTIYSLRHWMQLAVAGNPTILTLLFVPDDDLVVCSRLGKQLRQSSSTIVSQRAGRRFLGYLDSQLERLMGYGKQSRVPNRPELVEQYGYDCYLDDTEFLTRRGWLTYDNIENGEPVATVAQATGQVEFQVPSERVAKPYNGPIINIRHRYTECAVTPNHRMWVSRVVRGPNSIYGNGYVPERASWDFHRADELTRRHHHTRVAAATRHEEYPVTDALLTLIGAYVSEGSIAKRRKDGSVSVLALDQKVGGRLEPMLTTIGSSFSMRAFPHTKPPNKYRSKPCNTVRYTIADRELAGRVSNECGVGSHNIHLPSWAFDLSERQANILMDALMAGDGTFYRKTGYRIYYSMSRRLAGDVQALAIIAGRRSNMWGPYEKGIYQVLVQPSGDEIVTIKNSNNVTVENVTNARIVCFTVPNETLITRRNGRVAMHGNTKYAGHSVRLGLQGIELMNLGYVNLPMLEPSRSIVKRVRTGEYAFDEVIDLINAVRADLSDLLDNYTGPLPERPNIDRVNKLLIEMHQAWWVSRNDFTF